MKHIKISFAWLAMLALIFTSCSKEESGSVTEDQEKVQLTFGSLLNDFNSVNKQAEPGECTEGTPGYVLVGLTVGADASSTTYVDDGDPADGDNLIKVDLKNNSGSWETVYSDLLALPAGPYQLQHFIVYSTTHEVLWVAPRVGGSFEGYVNNPLPHLINLAAGTKPYINVDVLCFIPREEVAYGYPFFDLNVVRVENSYCIFVNYCPGDDGREVPAHFMVEVWRDGYGGDDEVTLSNYMNTVNTSGEWPSASVLCIALPDIGDDVLYARVSILDHNYYNADPEVNYIEFEITQEDIENQLEATPRYTHIRYGCQVPPGDPCVPGASNKPGDTNNDCKVNCEDTNTCGGPIGDCPNGPVPGDTNGDCKVNCLDTNDCGAETPGCDDTAYALGGVELNELGLYNGNNWGWGLIIDPDNDPITGPDFDDEYYNEADDQWEFPFIAGAGQNDIDKGWEAGLVIVTIEDGWLNVEIDLHEGVTMTESHIWFSESVGEDQWPENRAPGQFDLNQYSFELDDALDGPYTLIVHSGGVTHPSCDLD